jgi:DNA-binding MarR family transcriptional regulator
MESKAMADRELEDMSSRLHSVSIRLLRMLRREDPESGLTGPRLSVLSVLVFGGTMSLADLAAAEQVSAPTMSRFVEALVKQGLASREADPSNRRMVRIAATEEGVRLLDAGRERRVRALTRRLARLADSERRALGRAVELLEHVVK